MSGYINHKAERSIPTVEHEGFGLTDSKGREFGVNIYICKLTIAEGLGPKRDASDPYARYAPHLMEASTLAPGRYYSVHVQVTRDGKRYGASSSGRCFTTEREASAYIAQRVKHAQKRAAKG